jgi:hypothetical protein
MYVLSKIKINVLVIFAVMFCHDLITLSNINYCKVARKIYSILPVYFVYIYVYYK